MQNHSNESEFDLHENKLVGGTYFHMNGFALVLTLRQKGTRKWPITWALEGKRRREEWGGLGIMDRSTKCCSRQIACNSHTKPMSRHFLQTGLFLGFFSREIGQFRFT